MPPRPRPPSRSPAPPPPPSAASLPNTASATATNESAKDAEDNSDSATIVVNCPDIHVDKSADNSPISAGDTASYTIKVTNDGPGTARNVTLTDTLPAGVTWIRGQRELLDHGRCPVLRLRRPCRQGLGHRPRSPAPPPPPSAASLPNTASATASNESAKDAEDNSDSATIVVNCPDIHVDKSADNSPISAGDTASYTIKVTNDGPGTARNVTLTDTLPAGVTWTEDSASCSITAGVLSCDFGTLLPGATRTVTVSGETDAQDCGVLPNTASATASNESAKDAEDNSDSRLDHGRLPRRRHHEDRGRPVGQRDAIRSGSSSPSPATVPAAPTT